MASTLLSSEWSEHDFIKLSCASWHMENSVRSEHPENPFWEFQLILPCHTLLTQSSRARSLPKRWGSCTVASARLVVSQWLCQSTHQHAAGTTLCWQTRCSFHPAQPGMPSSVHAAWLVLNNFSSNKAMGGPRRNTEVLPKPCPQAEDNLLVAPNTQIPHQCFQVAALRQFHPYPKLAPSRSIFWQSLGSLWTMEFTKGHTDNNPIRYCPRTANYGSKPTYCPTTEIVTNCVPRADVPSAECPLPLENDPRSRRVQHH